ncbi:uncharacterized protein LOC124279757 isoform X2 [Haliotis rubra]|uniref:uncharacterized protein LOC124279757 isoform X2 n=1 Tax=Haliotis rubra TaxID=36100 RepID=UPI001EE61253|nr:uncharacterized protein LOC124279757 isoform X2 [Haliotis rubra]
MIPSDTDSSVLSSLEMPALGEIDRQDSMYMILISGLPSNAYEYLSQIPRGGVGRRKFSIVIVSDALHPMLNHHKYPTSILSQLLNNMNKDSAFVNAYETEGYIHTTLKDRLFCVGLKQLKQACKSICLVSLYSPMLQCNSKLGEVKQCVNVTHTSLVCIHKLCMLRDLWKKVLQKIRGSGISFILCLVHTHGYINRTDGGLTNDDHHKDKTIQISCVVSNIVQLLWSDTPFVFRCVINVDWNSIEHQVFRTWHLRELRLELSDFVKLGEGHYATDVLKGILEYIQNTQALTRQEYGLNLHVSGISNDASEVQPLGGFHQLVQILLLLSEISYMTKSLVDNILPKKITNESSEFNDDKGNDEGEIVQHDHLSTPDVREQKTVVHTVDQLHDVHTYDDTSQFLSKTHEEDMTSTFDKREAYNLFQNLTDKSLECIFPTFKKKAVEELKYVDKDLLYGDKFTRYLNTWQEVSVAPFYSLRHYFRKIETGENDEKMMYEALRLGSFCGININAFCIRLAEAGFYATGDADETRCFSCGVRHRGWQQKDNPFLIHRQIAPSCPLITGDDRRNVPINPNAEPSPFSVLSAEANPVPGGDTNEDLSNQSQISETYPNISTISYVSCDGGDKGASVASYLPDRSDRADADAGQDHTTYILRFEDAVYPNYSDNKVRVESFQMWPQYHCKRPEDLVPVGFFYAGYWRNRWEQYWLDCRTLTRLFRLCALFCLRRWSEDVGGGG